MTVIAIRDGVLACDTALIGGAAIVGNCHKWCEVPLIAGGGFAAFSGDFSLVANALSKMQAGQFEGFNVDGGLWIDHWGKVWEKNGDGPWFQYDAPFFAIGSGTDFALGALQMGATAREAVQVAIDLCKSCGGQVDGPVFPSS